MPVDETLKDSRECFNDSHFHAKDCPNDECHNYYPEDKLKQFIKRVKEDIKDYPSLKVNKYAMIDIINKHSGGIDK